MRNSLLDSVSHDPRTPLVVIAGKSGALLEMGEAVDIVTLQARPPEIEPASEFLARSHSEA